MQARREKRAPTIAHAAGGMMVSGASICPTSRWRGCPLHRIAKVKHDSGATVGQMVSRLGEAPCIFDTPQPFDDARQSPRDGGR